MVSAAFTVNDFIRKWRAVELKERSAAQEHFLDLCRLLGEPSPAEADPTGDFYCFERGATKTSGGEGWADVWKRGHFGWEYKGKRKNLDAAFGQLQQYALALENPPLLVVCDLDHFVIRTNWTNTVSERHDFRIEDLREPRTLQKLKWVMSDPEKLRPGKTRQDLTEDAAAEFATLAQSLRDRGHDSSKVAHFINRLVFCMFAEDVELLPAKMFLRMLQAAKVTPGEFQKLASSLFGAMKDGGLIGFERIDWFNGGLFDDDQALPLTADDITLCLRAAALDWSEIDPSIFGTLFVRGLDPGKRSETGSRIHGPEKDHDDRRAGHHAPTIAGMGGGARRNQRPHRTCLRLLSKKHWRARQAIPNSRKKCVPSKVILRRAPNSNCSAISRNRSGSAPSMP